VKRNRQYGRIFVATYEQLCAHIIEEMNKVAINRGWYVTIFDSLLSALSVQLLTRCDLATIRNGE